MIRCGGPRPLQSAGRHPAVHLEMVEEEAGIQVWQCPVCLRFLLVWTDDEN